MDGYIAPFAVCALAKAFNCEIILMFSAYE
jgi:hypothetical protein